MLVNLYKAKTPVSVFSLPLIVGLVCLAHFFREPADHVYFFKWQTDLFQKIQAMEALNFLLATILISLNAHQLNTVFNKNSFYSKDTFLPGFIYVTGIITFDAIDFSPLMLAHTFMLGALAALLQLKRQESSKNHIFIGSVCIGLTLVFSPLLIPLVIFPWLALLIIKPFIWREWVMAILGMALPVFYHYITYFMITGSWNIERLDVVLDSPKMIWTISESVSYLSALACVLIGLYRFIGVMRSQVVNFKKISQITLLVLLLTLFSFLTGWTFYNQFYLGFLLPLGFVISVHLLYSDRTTITNALVLIWFTAAAINLFL